MCSACIVARTAELYAERDHVAVSFRLIAWSERTTRPDAEVVNLRQARHRLIEAVRPHTPTPVGTDPWVLGAEAVRLLGHVRRALPPTSNRRVELERAIELVRRLAWGPED